MSRSPATRRALAGAAALGAAALAAGCASTTQQQTAGTPAPQTSSAAAHRATQKPGASASPSTGPATTAPPAAQGGCASSVLKAVVNVAQGSAAAGTAYYPVDFTNTSADACTMFGYPGVSFAAADGGARIGRAASRNPAVTPVTVTLPPGGVAHATIGVADAGNYSASACHPVTVHWLKIFPPDQTDPVYAHLTVQACSSLAHRLGSQLSVYATRGGPGKRSEGP